MDLNYFSSPPLPTEPVDPRAKKALATDPSGDPALAAAQKRFRELQELTGVVNAGEHGGLTRDISKFGADLGRSRKESKKRKPLIYAAIALVTLGGMLEFIGGVLFQA